MAAVGRIAHFGVFGERFHSRNDGFKLAFRAVNLDAGQTLFAGHEATIGQQREVDGVAATAESGDAH